MSKGVANIPALNQRTVRVEKRKPLIMRFKWKSVLFPVLVLVVWQLSSVFGWLNPILLPTPYMIVESFFTLIKSGELATDLKISLLRAVLGLLLGGGLGLIIGIVVGLSKGVEDFLDPTIQTLRTIPHLAVIPLFILWFGLGELSKVLMIASGAFFPLYINTFMGIRGVDSKLFDVARILEFNRWKQLTRLVIPAAMPNILLGLRLSIGVSWLGLVVAELMGSSSGVGYMIQNATQFSQTSIVFVGISIFALVGKLSDSIVRSLERRLLRWRSSYQG
jgi:sulfonate transport system permease protein